MKEGTYDSRTIIYGVPFVTATMLPMNILAGEARYLYGKRKMNVENTDC